jgi:hypothetical protein
MKGLEVWNYTPRHETSYPCKLARNQTQANDAELW